MSIHRLTEHDAAIFWALRLRGLREHPEAFGASYEDSAARPLAEVERRLRNEGSSPDNFVLGAFSSEGVLTGVVGFARDEGLKVRHKGMIWGMYVMPEARGKGSGKALLSAAIERAKAVSGLDQLYLAVVTERVEARRLYLQLGFTIYGIEPRALKIGDRYYDEELMFLPLNEVT